MIKPLLDLLFPKVCSSCDAPLYSGEVVLCTPCRHDLPLCAWKNPKDNLITDKLRGRVDLNYADALLYFEKRNKTQSLIHDLKYKKQEHISSYLGQWQASKLTTEKWANQIDVIVPVPLHYKRLKYRGYNQVEGYARELSNVLGCVYDDTLLKRKQYSRTQVFKNRLSRTDVIEHNFMLNATQKYEGKHIALADDLITTGATAEACFLELSKIKDVKLSMLVMAVA